VLGWGCIRMRREEVYIANETVDVVDRPDMVVARLPFRQDCRRIEVNLADLDRYDVGSNVREDGAHRARPKLNSVKVLSVNARFFEPMLCLAVPKLPEGSEWQLELKLDGYRGIGIKTNGRAHLVSRNGKNFSERFPTVTRALNRLPDETVIDGEISRLMKMGGRRSIFCRTSAAPTTPSCSMLSIS
jgi:ATP-dependent DNA ligase